MVVHPGSASALRSGIAQFIIIIIINIPTLSFGLTLGWVSVESGALATEESAAHVVAGAALTLVATAGGVPLAAWVLTAAGRKPALIATSAGFLVCWLLCVCGGWWVVAGRIVAGLCGAAAWAIAPLLAREMCSPGVRGAAGGAPVAAHNLGMLLMYLSADQRLQTDTVLWSCVSLSAAHCLVCLFIPESPSFLAANGNLKEATMALSILRGGKTDVSAELEDLPPPTKPESHVKALRDMWHDNRQRKALVIAVSVVAGQEMCGLLTLLQFAERVFQIAGTETRASGLGMDEGASAARRALLLGAVQLGGSLVALGLVERTGRRPLLLYSSIATCLSLTGAFICLLARTNSTITWAVLAVAVLSDSCGVQTAPFAILADMFKVSSVILLATSMTGVAGAMETIILPVIAGNLGLSTAFGVASILAGVYAGFVMFVVPETKGRSPEEILDVISPINCCNNNECTKV